MIMIDSLFFQNGKKVCGPKLLSEVIRLDTLKWLTTRAVASPRISREGGVRHHFSGKGLNWIPL